MTTLQEALGVGVLQRSMPRVDVFEGLQRLELVTLIVGGQEVGVRVVGTGEAWLAVIVDLGGSWLGLLVQMKYALYFPR